MNAHQRRKTSRCDHMLLPLGKRIDFNALQGRTVYAYGALSCHIAMDSRAMDQIGSATVHRHFRGLIDLLLISRDGVKQVIQTSKRGIRLLDSADRAPRPWWVETRRKHAAAAKQRSAA